MKLTTSRKPRLQVKRIHLFVVLLNEEITVGGTAGGRVDSLQEVLPGAVFSVVLEREFVNDDLELFAVGIDSKVVQLTLSNLKGQAGSIAVRKE